MLEEQGLPALLPYGWSPRGAAWVDLNGAALASAATLTLPVDAPNGTALAVVRLDLATLQWHTQALATAAGGRVTVNVAAEGGFAVVEADPVTVDPAPPAAVAGTVLGSSPAPTGSEVTAAALTFNPATVLPSQRSLVTVDYTVTGTPPSGVPLTLTVREELTLLDGGVRRQAPYEADVVMYRRADTGAPRSRFGLRPSEEAQTTPLEMGAEDVTVELYAGESVRGNVLGPVGGSVASPEGDRVDVPANALPEPDGDLPGAPRPGRPAEGGARGHRLPRPPRPRPLRPRAGCAPHSSPWSSARRPPPARAASCSRSSNWAARRSTARSPRSRPPRPAGPPRRSIPRTSPGRACARAVSTSSPA